MTNEGATMNIPEEALTAAQDAYWEGVEEARENGTESVGHYLGLRAALSAAAPTLMAMALRDAARDLSWFGAQGNTVEPNTAWAGVTACMNALNNIADELEQL